MEATQPGWKCHCKTCNELYECTEPGEQCPNGHGIDSLESSSIDPVLMRCYGVRPSKDWPAILALHRHALYSELEVMELYNIYKQKGSDGGFKEFIESRFIRHPFYADTKYMWRTDYQRALDKLNAQQGAAGLVRALPGEKKSESA